MNGTEFSRALRRALGKLPSHEVEQSVAFYEEMIADRMEDGMREEDAVAALGPVDAIAAQIIAELPPVPKAMAKASTGSRALNVVLLAALSPVWVPLALALALAVAGVYLCIWLCIAALWLTVAALVLCAPLGACALAWGAAHGQAAAGAFQMGVGLVASGVGLFALFGALSASKRLAGLTGKFGSWLKSRFVKPTTGTAEAGIGAGATTRASAMGANAAARAGIGVEADPRAGADAGAARGPAPVDAEAARADMEAEANMGATARAGAAGGTVASTNAKCRKVLLSPARKVTLAAAAALLACGTALALFAAAQAGFDWGTLVVSYDLSVPEQRQQT